MNIRSLAALAAVLGLSTAAYAQTFDASAGEGAALAQRARDSRHGYDVKGADFVAQGAPKAYARTIVCAHPPKEAYLPDGLRFYTGLDAHPPKTVQRDETAAALADYRRAYVQEGKFHFDAWSCDTQDYWFTFDAESLLKATAGEKSRSIKGHARIETRGQVDWEGDLDCVANF